MHDQFNLVSLTNLSTAELLAMLANLQGQFNAVSCNTERGSVRAKIATVKQALTF